MKKIWVCTYFLFLLGLYAPAELTRVIVLYKRYYDPGVYAFFFNWTWWIEITFIWLCFVGMAATPYLIFHYLKRRRD